MVDSDLVCFCNRVTRSVLRTTVESGAQTLDQVYERCGAGVGPCGGSCRPLIQKELSSTSPNSVLYEWPPQVIESISLFNRRYYWESHELLEHLWLDERGDIKVFYQGIIQAAAAFYHVLGDNPKGVIRLAQEAHSKLSRFGPIYKDTINISDLLQGLRLFGQEAKDILGSTSQGFDFDKLPKFRSS